MRLFFSCTFVLVFLCVGCSKGKLHPAEYRAWMNNPDNGMCIEKKVGDIVFTSSLRTPEYMVLNEWDSENENESPFEKRLEEMKQYQYINLRFDSKDKKTEALKSGLRLPAQYYERIQYLTTLIPSDAFLIDGIDTLPCKLHHYERTYKMSSFCDVSLVFESKGQTDTDKILVFEDNLFGTGTQQFRFEKNKLNNVPELIAYP